MQLPRDIPESPDWFHPNYKDIVRGTDVFYENLPLPYVNYPQVYGTWLSFQKTRDGIPYFCECQRSPMINWLRLQSLNRTHNYSREYSPFLTTRLQGKLDFIHTQKELEKADCFIGQLCHRCLKKVPSIRWSNLGSHSTFLQHFGWYFNQELLSYGFDSLSPLLPDQAPYEIQLLVTDNLLTLHRNILATSSKIRELEKSLELNRNEDPQYVFLREKLKEIQGARKGIVSSVEYLTECNLRAEFNFPKKGRTGNQEAILNLIVKGLFPNSQILLQARPSFLKGLTFDIYLPEHQLAIEFQGIQHYKPMKHLGGETGFKKTRERDWEKALICKEMKIALHYFDVSDKLTEEYIGSKLSNYLNR